VLTFDKHEMLCHDLLLIEAWCEEVFPRLAARVPEKAASKGYFVLYHEATVLNLLAVFLYHACEAMGEVLLELIDYCMGKIVRLHCRRATRWRSCSSCRPRSSPRSWRL